MALREALFAAAASAFFAPGKLSLAFVGEGREFAPIVVDVWELTESSARGVVTWRVPESTRVDAVRLYDGLLLVEERLLRDDKGKVGAMSLLGGMEFEYGYLAELVEAGD